MSTQLFNVEDTAKSAVAMVPTEPQAFMAVIARAATDGSVDVSKMEKLWDIYKNMVAWHAEQSFNAAFSEMQAKLPVITEHGQIKVGNEIRSNYAFYEDINEAVKPILQEFGFGVMFKTDDSIPDKVRVIGILTHRDGHRESCPLSLPADTSGSKNNVQAHGSSISYAKRYIITDLLNITTRGQDDDGMSAGAKTITESQAADLRALMDEVKVSNEKLLSYLSSKAKRPIKTLMEIPARLHPEAVAALEGKRNESSAKKGGK